jgi:hypothetical protein
MSSAGFSFFSRGRYALAVGALRLIPRAGEGVILLPSYVCRSVTDSLRQFGCPYRFYPVTREGRLRMDLIERALSDDVSSLLFINYFGFPQDISLLMPICRERDVVVIEDNAHGFLGIDREGRPLGARGDIGIFSFPKTIYLPDGGGMVVNNPGVIDWIDSLPSYGIKHGLNGTFLLKRQVLKTFRTLGIDQKVIDRIKRRREEENENSVEEDWGISMISRYLLERVNPRSSAVFRRRNYTDVLNICRDEGLDALYGELEEGVCPYLVPVVAPPGEIRDKVTRILRGKGWRVSHWPDLPPDLDTDDDDDGAFWLRKNIMAVYLRPAVV